MVKQSCYLALCVHAALQHLHQPPAHARHTANISSTAYDAWLHERSTLSAPLRSAPLREFSEAPTSHGSMAEKIQSPQRRSALSASISSFVTKIALTQSYLRSARECGAS